MSAYMKKAAAGDALSVSYRKFMQALVLGNYNSFQQGDSPFVIDIFETSSDRPTSPLLRLSILKLLIEKAGEADGEAGYINYPQLVMYFDAMGASREALDEALTAMLDYRLVEPFDASSKSLSDEQRIAITHSGRMHVEMALNDPLYLSQMAFAAPIRSASVVERLREIKQGKMSEREWDEVRRVFALYCFAQDRTFLRVPRDPMFDGQRVLRKDINSRWVGAGVTQETDEAGTSVGPKESLHSHLTGEVKWFDPVKGFGFIDAGLSADVFLHINTLQRAGIQSIAIGDMVVCDVGPGKDGKPQAISVHSMEAGREPVQPGGKAVAGEVLFYNAQKGFGFIRAEGVAEDVYFSASLLQAAGKAEIATSQAVRLEVSDYIRGRGRSATSLEIV